ncbi:MAG: LysR substrate-binding domain-containing protein [Janthinobacterium lividum]
MNYDDTPQRRLTMSLRQIEVFRAIMIAGSISEAARSLLIAQPSVSRVLQLTEERLGFLLFERSRGRLFPTPEARRIFEEVELAYAGIQRVDDLVRALVDGRSGKLTVVCSPSLGVHVVPRAIARFNRRYPELPVHFEPLTHNNLVPRVLFGKHYLGITMFEVAHPNLQTEPLGMVPMLCAVPLGQAGTKATLTLADLRGQPWIDYGHDTPLGRVVGAAFGDTPRPEPIVEVRSAISACTLVQEGVGVALIDPFCVDALARTRIDVRPLAPARTLTVQAAYSRAEPLSHSARSFLRLLRQLLDEDLRRG